MSNLFKPPADNTAPSTGPDFASRWGSAAGGGQGEAPRSFSEAYRRYGGLPGDAGFGGAEQQSQDDFAPPASAKGRLVGLRSTPGRTPYGIAPPADRFVSPASNDPRDFVAPRDNPDVNQEALDILQKRYGYLTAPIRNNNPGAISNSLRRGGYKGDMRPAAEGGWYTRFNTPEQGVHAQSELLRGYGRRGLNTPAAIFQKWATGGRPEYARFVAEQLGVEPSTTLDLEDPHIREQIVKAASRHEAGLSGKNDVAPYKDEVYRRGVAGLFGRP